MQQTNQNIIKGCKAGNRKSQMRLYDDYCSAMYNIACRYLPNNEDAKDAMQDGFIKAFANIDKYKPTFTIGSWLKRIVINQCLDVLKKRKLHFEEITDAEIFIENETDWHFEPQITKGEIIEAIAELPQKYRLVIQLYLIEGYDHEEVSQILDIPIKTSRTHLRRGKEKLKAFLKKRHYEGKE